MKKLTLFIYMLTVILINQLTLEAITLKPANGPYTVGQTIYFSGTATYWDSTYYAPRISFGDGEVSYGISYSVAVPHRYRAAGTYTVALMATGSTMTAPPSEFRILTIVDTRSITYTPANPVAGQIITFTANNFATPENIRWDFGDGTSITQNGGNIGHGATFQVTHTYTRPGSYTVRAYDWDGSDSVGISLSINIGEPARSVTSNILTPREDQLVQLQANNFISQEIAWNFGDGTILTGSPIQTHRFMKQGLVTISALDSTYTQTPTTLSMTILPENRTITATPTTTINNQPVTFTANEFRGDGVLWNFGDGTRYIGKHQETHIYTKAGLYTVRARDESGSSTRRITTQVLIRGISDEVILHHAEIRFDNGRAYRVVAKESRHMQAELKLKMEGTGLITGTWILDGQPFRAFSQLAKQGEVILIKTGFTPPLPTIDPGLHRITVQMTRPEVATLPEISYYVEPVSALLELLEPKDDLVIKEDEVPQFSWTPVRGASYYEIAFSDTLFSLFNSSAPVRWHVIRDASAMTPHPDIWTPLTRNAPIYWQIRAKDSAGQIISQSEPRSLELKLNPAQIVILFRYRFSR